MSPPKQKRRLCGTALRSAEQLAGYVTSCVLQARRGLDVLWRARATRREDEQLQLDLPREEQTLFGFLEEISSTPKKRDRDATASILQTQFVAETKAKKQIGELS